MPRYQITPELLNAVIQRESGGDPFAVSSKGAVGPGQVLPSTLRKPGFGVKPAMDDSPKENVRVARDLLNKFANRYNGDPSLVLAAYNAGPGVVDKVGGVPDYPETQEYVKNVLSDVSGANVPPIREIPTFEEFRQQRKSERAAGTQKAQSGIPSYAEFREMRKKDRESAVHQYDPTAGISSGELFLAGTGRGLTNLARGAGQIAREILPEELSNKLGLPTEQDIAEANRLDKPLTETTPGTLGEITGEIAGSLPLPGGSLLKGALSGGLLGALRPTEESESRGFNILSGAAGGAAGEGAVKLAGRALRPVRSTLGKVESVLAEKAKKFGIDLDSAQLTDSKPLKWIASVLHDLPATSEGQRAFTESQQKQFNRAIAKTLGSDADNFGEDVMAEIRERVGGEIGEIAKRNTLNVDNAVLDDLSKFEQSLGLETDANARIAKGYVDELLGKVNAQDQVPGEAFRTLDSAIGRRIRGTTDGDLRRVLGKFQKTIRDGMDRSITPEDSAAWKLARVRYANLSLIEPLAKKSPNGNIPPALLLAAATKGRKNAAYSEYDLKTLGKVGKQFLKEPPQSGTAPRSFYTKLLTNPFADVTAGGGLGYLYGGEEGALQGAAAGAFLSSGLLGTLPQLLLNTEAGKRYATKGILPLLQNLEDPVSRYLAAPAGAQGLLNSLYKNPNNQNESR